MKSKHEAKFNEVTARASSYQYSTSYSSTTTNKTKNNNHNLMENQNKTPEILCILPVSCTSASATRRRCRTAMVPGSKC
jgi:hypothetical protein